MNDVSRENKKAWEHRAYELRYTSGKGGEIRKGPKACLRYHRKYFENIQCKRIADVCGSNGRIAVRLAVLGADDTVFDLSGNGLHTAVMLA